MKIGHSNLLGEYFEAVQIEHKDCERFQVVCPSCREPVFKAVRPNDGQELHYLSHYKKDSTYNDDCEMRVAALSKSDIDKQNGSSRDQKLRYFLSVIKDAILVNEYPSDAPSFVNTKSLMSRMYRKRMLTKLKQGLREICKMQYAALPLSSAEDILEGYVSDIKEVNGEFFPTTFSIEIQKRITWDVWQSLLSDISKENFYFLFDHAYIFLLTRLEKSSLVGWDKNLYDGMFDLIEVDDGRAQEILENFSRTPVGPPYAHEGMDLYLKMCSEINHEMLGCLLRLPYAEMLKSAIAKIGAR